MGDRRQPTDSGQRQTLLTFHEAAYRSGWRMAVSLLEAVVGLQDARREYLADGNVASRFVADREFIRGILDALLPAMDDTVSLLENKVRHELREAIMYDLYDNAKGVLGRIQDKEPEYKFSSAKGLY